MKITTGLICRSLIIVSYAAMLTGFLIPAYIPLALKLFPWHLLLLFVLLIISHRNKNKKFLLFLSLVYLAGFIVELFGIHTGLIFGKYYYGNTLGIKFAEIPLLIGINWIIWIYSAGALVKKIRVKNPVINSGIGAVILTLLDIMREPAAVKFNFRAWAEMEIPFQNYASWFIFSFLMLRLFFELDFKNRNNTAAIIILCQLLFFIALNLWGF